MGEVGGWGCRGSGCRRAGSGGGVRWDARMGRSRCGRQSRYTRTSSRMMMETQNRRFPVTAILPVGKPEMTQCRHRLVIQKQEHLKIAPQVARWSSGPFLVTPVLTVDGLCVPSGDEVATPGILAGRM